MNSDEFTALARVCDSIQRGVNILDEDMGDILKKMDTIMVRQGKIEEILERLLDQYDRQTKKLGQKVEDAVEKQIETVAEQVNQITEAVTGGE